MERGRGGIEGTGLVVPSVIRHGELNATIKIFLNLYGVRGSFPIKNTLESNASIKIFLGDVGERGSEDGRKGWSGGVKDGGQRVVPPVKRHRESNANIQIFCVSKGWG